MESEISGVIITTNCDVDHIRPRSSMNTDIVHMHYGPF